MASTAPSRSRRSKPRSSAGTAKSSGHGRRNGKATTSNNKHTASKPTTVTGKLAGKAVKKVVARALRSSALRLRAALENGAAAGGEATTKTMEKTKHWQLPIQCSIDIAVPLSVAWQEWVAFDFVPEGIHSVTDVEFDGGRLIGRIAGRETNWAAEILDQRDEQSFAWHSGEGSDCAGLITFHKLSDRLTRVELNLDVVATTVSEAFQLTTHLADHRAERDLRRFKARLELISPDLYEEDDAEEPVTAAEEEEPQD